MRILLAALACVAGCASDAPAGKGDASALALANPGFEEADLPDRCPPRWTCIVHGAHAHTWQADPRSPGAGARSFCVSPLDPVNNWLFVYQGFPGERLRGTRLRLSALVRADADPGPGTGPSLLAIGGDGSALVEERRIVRDSGGWRRLATELTIPPNAFQVQAGILFQSHAVACVDDVRLEIVPGS